VIVGQDVRVRVRHDRVTELSRAELFAPDDDWNLDALGGH
jgi:hypothetical protein